MEAVRIFDDPLVTLPLSTAEVGLSAGVPTKGEVLAGLVCDGDWYGYDVANAHISPLVAYLRGEVMGRRQHAVVVDPTALSGSFLAAQPWPRRAAGCWGRGRGRGADGRLHTARGRLLYAAATRQGGP